MAAGASGGRGERLQTGEMMAVSLYTVSAPIFVQMLQSMSAILDKASAHIETHKLDPSFFMNMRLYPDMFPFVRQVRAVSDHAVGGVGRLAGVELPAFQGNETTIAELQARIARAIDFIKSIKREQVDGQEEREIVLKFASGERKFTGQGYLLNFALPNFYFHHATAYDILRHCGVVIGKRDFMGTPVTL
jgi:hypothetical protein